MYTNIKQNNNNHSNPINKIKTNKDDKWQWTNNSITNSTT